jgi:hypothetical protein
MEFVIDNYPEYNFSVRLVAGIKNLDQLKSIEKSDNVIVLNPKYVYIYLYLDNYNISATASDQ